VSEESNTPLTSDEKMYSAVAYFFGPLGAVIVWMLQKEKSRFIRFHATQALTFDFIVMIGTSVLFFCVFGTVFVEMFGAIFAGINNSSSPDSIPVLIYTPALMPFTLFTCIFPFTFGLTILRIIAAISVLTGRDFHYPWLGRRVEKFLDEG